MPCSTLHTLFMTMKTNRTRHLTAVSLACALAGCTPAPKSTDPACSLDFDDTRYEQATLTTPRGDEIHYKAYTQLYYVEHVEDSAYQFLNVFVPEGATQHTPILMRNYVGGYMAAAARFPDANDATGRALQEGYVVVIPGVRGRNSSVTGAQGETVYTGRAPKAILDLKAAVRYLRHVDDKMPGDAEKIITDGTSAGGAMSALQGAAANDAVYEPLLKEMGAAPTSDKVFASVCYCPITDLDHADMAYEWLYGQTSREQRQTLYIESQISLELKAEFERYINSLDLRKPDGSQLNAENYLDYVKQLLIASAQKAKDAGADIPDTIGFRISSTSGFAAPLNGQPRGATFSAGRPAGMPNGRGRKQQGDEIVDLDMQKYLDYVASTQPLKPCPAFDNLGVAGKTGTGENDVFGDDKGGMANFTDFALKKATGDSHAETDSVMKAHVAMMNPMTFIRQGNTNLAPHWYIRHGARDRDTAFPIPINLATKLQNAGADVDFELPWNRPHSGDYALNDLFEWMKEITK